MGENVMKLLAHYAVMDDQNHKVAIVTSERYHGIQFWRDLNDVNKRAVAKLRPTTVTMTSDQFKKNVRQVVALARHAALSTAQLFFAPKRSQDGDGATFLKATATACNAVSVSSNALIFRANSNAPWGAAANVDLQQKVVLKGILRSLGHTPELGNVHLEELKKLLFWTIAGLVRPILLLKPYVRRTSLLGSTLGMVGMDDADTFKPSQWFNYNPKVSTEEKRQRGVVHLNPMLFDKDFLGLGAFVLIHEASHAHAATDDHYYLRLTRFDYTPIKRGRLLYKEPKLKRTSSSVSEPEAQLGHGLKLTSALRPLDLLAIHYKKIVPWSDANSSEKITSKQLDDAKLRTNAETIAAIIWHAAFKDVGDVEKVLFATQLDRCGGSFGRRRPNRKGPPPRRYRGTYVFRS